MLTICIVVNFCHICKEQQRKSVPVKIWDISSPKSTSCACSRLVLSSLYTFAHVNRFHKHLNKPGERGGGLFPLTAGCCWFSQKQGNLLGITFSGRIIRIFCQSKTILFLFILHLELISNKKNVSFHIFTFLFH